MGCIRLDPSRAVLSPEILASDKDKESERAEIVSMIHFGVWVPGVLRSDSLLSPLLSNGRLRCAKFPRSSESMWLYR